MQTGLQLEQCHYKDPLLFVNRSLQDSFSGKQLLLPPACFYALLWGAGLSWQASFAFLLYVWFIKRTQRVAGCTMKPGLYSWVHQKGVGTRFTFHSHVGQLGEQEENPSGKFWLPLVFSGFSLPRTIPALLPKGSCVLLVVWFPRGPKEATPSPTDS